MERETRVHTYTRAAWRPLHSSIFPYFYPRFRSKEMVLDGTRQSRPASDDLVSINVLPSEPKIVFMMSLRCCTISLRIIEYSPRV